MKLWTDELDLTNFYHEALSRGFLNNANRKMLVDGFLSERDKAVWILYFNNVAAGSVAAHSLDIFDKPSYRICARTCVFTNLLPFKHLRTLKHTVQQHQNITAQFYIPQCIEYCPIDSDLYITTNVSKVASQRLVHEIYCPALEQQGCLEKTYELEYRGHLQTFWKLNKDEFTNQLRTVPHWDNLFINNDPTDLK
ncbi:MAG: hypothetical protein ACOVLB_07120 [Candidatus Nanopelagicus sp.]